MGDSSESVRDVAQELAELYKEGVRKPTMLVMNPLRYAKLVATSERVGVMDLDRIKALVDDIAATPLIPENKIILLHNIRDVVEIVFGGDGEVDYIGPENGSHSFRIWSSLATLIKDPRGIVVLESSL